MARRRSADPAERRARHAAVEDPAVVMEAAATFLAVRSRSVDETRRRLVHHGYREALVEKVLGRLVEMDYLDDAAFARAWVQSRDRARPRGETALRRELALKGIDRDTITQVLAERSDPGSNGDDGPFDPARADDDPDADGGLGPDAAAAERLLDRRRSMLLRVADPRRRREKAYGLLARNGFAPDVCRAAALRFMASTDPPAGDPDA